MARILITGSAGGIGSLAAQKLAQRGHHVYLHARSPSRARDATTACPQAQDCLVGDLASLADVKALSSAINALGGLDCIIHNAGVMRTTAKSPDGWGLVFGVNTLAPYVLSSLVAGNARRHVFLSSSMAGGRDASLRELHECSYSDSKLHNIMLALAFPRLLRGQIEESHAVDPGWVPTKMGGRGAPGDIGKSVEAYVKLAEGVGSTGGYWGPGAQPKEPPAGAEREEVQQKLLDALEQASGVKPVG